MSGVPAGFVRLPLPQAGFIAANGPLHGKRQDGRFVMGFRVEARHCNPAGHCHGGMLATLADMLLAMGSNLEAELSSFLVTVSLTCDYLQGVPVGTWLEGRVDVLRVTRRLVFSQGLLSDSGAPVLRCSGTLRRPVAPDPALATGLFLPRG